MRTISMTDYRLSSFSVTKKLATAILVFVTLVSCGTESVSESEKSSGPVYVVKSEAYIPNSGRDNSSLRQESMRFNTAGTEVRVTLNRSVASMDDNFGTLTLFSSSFFGQTHDLLPDITYKGLDPNDTGKKTIVFRLKSSLSSHRFYSGSSNHDYVQLSLQFKRDRSLHSKHESPFRDRDGNPIPYDRTRGLDDADAVSGYYDAESPEGSFLLFTNTEISIEFKEDIFFTDNFSQDMVQVFVGGNVTDGAEVTKPRYSGPTTIGGQLTNATEENTAHYTMIYDKGSRNGFVIRSSPAISQGLFKNGRRYTVLIKKEGIEDVARNKPSQNVQLSRVFPQP